MRGFRESTLEKAVCAYATQHGWQSFKLNGPGDRGKPDRVFFRPGGQVRFVEFKAPGQPLRPLQQHVLQRLRDCQLRCAVIDSLEAGQRLFDESEAPDAADEQNAGPSDP